MSCFLWRQVDKELHCREVLRNALGGVLEDKVSALEAVSSRQHRCICRARPSVMFQVNLEYLESKLESIDGEEVQRIQDNINALFHHCVQALGEEHQIKVVNALQACKFQEDPGHTSIIHMLPSVPKNLKNAYETITVIKLLWSVRVMNSCTVWQENAFLVSHGTF